MRKKLLIAALAVLTVILAYFALTKLPPQQQSGQKTVYITLLDEMSEQVIIDKQAYKTSATTLGSFFDENPQGISVKLEASSFGRFILEINGLDGSKAEGPWILYDSPNNQVCLASGLCSGIDDLPIFDGDEFVFRYTLTYSFE